ncbi:Uncharacterized protein At2g39920 [Linum grandiflorum]
MSAYAHQMEREYSAGSLSSAEDSGIDVTERGSRYVMESGFYMTSFAATIFIALLVTVGVLMVSLLILLTVMLQACESRNNGVVEMQTKNVNYHYCKSLAMHAELNNLPSLDFPPVCSDLATRHDRVVEYQRDLTTNLQVVERYLDGVAPPSEDGKDVVLIDVDSILILSPHFNHSLSYRWLRHGCDDCSMMQNHSRLVRLYKKLQTSGWLLVLVSRNQEGKRNATVEQLNSAGYSSWSSLVLRSDSEVKLSTAEYFSRRRLALETEGFRIAAMISSQMDALRRPCPGTRIFKLPNPQYYFVQDYRRSSNLPEDNAFSQ